MLFPGLLTLYSVSGDIGPWSGSKGCLPGYLTGLDKDAEGVDDVDVPGRAVDGEVAETFQQQRNESFASDSSSTLFWFMEIFQRKD